jgi:hypothetical protein
MQGHCGERAASCMPWHLHTPTSLAPRLGRPERTTPAPSIHTFDIPPRLTSSRVPPFPCVQAAAPPAGAARRLRLCRRLVLRLGRRPRGQPAGDRRHERGAPRGGGVRGDEQGADAGAAHAPQRKRRRVQRAQGQPARCMCCDKQLSGLQFARVFVPCGFFGCRSAAGRSSRGGGAAQNGRRARPSTRPAPPPARLASPHVPLRSLPRALRSTSARTTCWAART